MHADDEIVERELRPLRDTLQTLKQRVNPQDENLHFPARLYVSSDDFESLARIGSAGLRITQEHWSVFFEDPYAASMFWYDYSLLVSAASLSRLNGGGPVSVDAAIPSEILTVLLGISECMLRGGDSSKRCAEGIGNLLLAFPDENLRQLVRDRISQNQGSWAGRFLVDVLERVKSAEDRTTR